VIIDVKEATEMAVEQTVIVRPFHGRILDCEVYPLKLFVCPWMDWLGEATLDHACDADQVKPNRPRIRWFPIARLFTKLDVIVH
jgi:hypothetical protein